MVKNPPRNAGDTSLIPGSGRPHGEGNGNPLQYLCLENPMDRATVHAAALTGASSPETKVLPVWFLPREPGRPASLLSAGEQHGNAPSLSSGQGGRQSHQPVPVRLPQGRPGEGAPLRQARQRTAPHSKQRNQRTSDGSPSQEGGPSSEHPRALPTASSMDTSLRHGPPSRTPLEWWKRHGVIM